MRNKIKYVAPSISHPESRKEAVTRLQSEQETTLKLSFHTQNPSCIVVRTGEQRKLHLQIIYLSTRSLAIVISSITTQNRNSLDCLSTGLLPPLACKDA